MMFRNHTHYEREREATESLKIISESPWLFDSSERKIPKVLKTKPKAGNKSFEFEKIRPNTEQRTRQRDKDIDSHKLQSYKIRTSMFTDTKLDDLAKYRFSQESSSKEFKESYRAKSQLRSKQTFRKKNYSELRKSMEKDFFIGSKSTSLQKKEVHAIAPSRSIHRGRLWLGRPVLIFSKQKSNLKPFFEK